MADDWGLAYGVGEGLKSGFDAYMQARKMKLLEDKLDSTKKDNNDSLKLQMHAFEQGYKINPDGTMENLYADQSTPGQVRFGQRGLLNQRTATEAERTATQGQISDAEQYNTLKKNYAAINEQKKGGLIDASTANELTVEDLNRAKAGTETSRQGLLNAQSNVIQPKAEADIGLRNAQTGKVNTEAQYIGPQAEANMALRNAQTGKANEETAQIAPQAQSRMDVNQAQSDRLRSQMSEQAYTDQARRGLIGAQQKETEAKIPTISGNFETSTRAKGYIPLYDEETGQYNLIKSPALSKKEDLANFETQSKIEKNNAQAGMYGRMPQPRQGQTAHGKMLPPKIIEDLSTVGETIPKIMEDFNNVIEKNKDQFGPVQGRMNSWNPYNTVAQDIESLGNDVKQTIGKMKEGGVLRKEDEIKYNKMMPRLSDNYHVAKDKLQRLGREMGIDYNARTKALSASQYDISGLPPSINIKDLPIAMTQGPEPLPGQVPLANAGEGKFLPDFSAMELNKPIVGPDGNMYKKTGHNSWKRVSPNAK